MASTSGTRADLSAVFSGNSSSSSDFFEDSDDSCADKDFVPSNDNISSDSTEVSYIFFFFWLTMFLCKNIL